MTTTRTTHRRAVPADKAGTPRACRSGAPRHRHASAHGDPRDRSAPGAPARRRRPDPWPARGPGLYGEALHPLGTWENHVGEVSGFAPPGDIRRIRNTGTRSAISLHIYGTDITRIGSSARRYYS